MASTTVDTLITRYVMDDADYHRGDKWGESGESPDGELVRGRVEFFLPSTPKSPSISFPSLHLGSNVPLHLVQRALKLVPRALQLVQRVL